MSIQSASKQQGVGIIEVLVALLIASIGLLGIVAIQGNRVKMAQQEVQMSMATILVTEMAERMRANVKGASDDHYNDAEANGDANNFPAVNCTPCSVEEVADKDLHEWEDKIERNLISGVGKITEEATDPGNFTIAISWLDKDLKARKEELNDLYVPPTRSIKVVIKEIDSETTPN